MPTKKFKPTTPSRRHMTVPTFEEITKFSPEKSLTVVKKKFSGRNSYGRITVRHRGGGNKIKYRIIDFKRQSLAPATVIRSEEHTSEWKKAIVTLTADSGEIEFFEGLN